MAQHVGKMIEELEEKDLGKEIDRMRIPAIGWQDDITAITNNEDEKEKMTEGIEKSAKKNRINLSEDDKCKILIINKNKDTNSGDTKIGELKLKKVDNAKILGHIFQESNEIKLHIKEKEKEVTEMVASMGLTINNNNMHSIYIQSILILYQKCFIPKLLFGITGFNIKEKEMETIETLNRKVIRNFLNLPKCTPKAALYIEFGIIPIEMEIQKKKLMMWNRINKSENKMIRKIKNEQINKNLPWVKQLIEIARKIGIDLVEGKEDSKDRWKRKVNDKIMESAKIYLKKERDKLKRYKENIQDDIEPGVRKNYMNMNVKKAGSIFRARTDIMDPKPRKTYWEKTIWRCKFCNEKSQSSRHYVEFCVGTERYFKDKIDRKIAWQIISTLEDNEGKMMTIASILQEIIKEINN